MIKNIAPYISVPAGLISITNFIFTILPVDSVPSWWIQLSNTHSHFKFPLFIILSFITCFFTAKFLKFFVCHDISLSIQSTFYAIISSLFSWLIVYNTKFMMLNNSLEGDNTKIFVITCFILYQFCNFILDSDLSDTGYFTANEDIPLFGSTPTALIFIRTIFFWLVLIFLGFYYTIPTL